MLVTVGLTHAEIERAFRQIICGELQIEELLDSIQLRLNPGEMDEVQRHLPDWKRALILTEDSLGGVH